LKIKGNDRKNHPQKNDHFVIDRASGAIPRARFKILLREAQQWFVSVLVVRLPYFIAIFVEWKASMDAVDLGP
jgi:hypothetical protein